MLLTIVLTSLLVPLCSGAPQPKIDAPGCGKRPLLADNGESEIKTAASRIVGGTETVPFTWPSICSFMTSTGYHICGSTLVKNKAGLYYLVTAAHCLSSNRPNRYLARCGLHKMSGSNPNSTLLTFSQLRMHEGYSDITFDNDIAIFTLTSQPKESVYLQPACIASTPHHEGEAAIVAGWGTLSYGGEAATELRQVSKPIKGDATCASRYPNEFNPANMLCAGEPQGGVDACQGDSGGPLYTYRNDQWTLTGVVSWGYGCASPKNPGVYADVHNLNAWIDKVINQ